ncbi:MalM family protein [Marinobacter sp.]|uniref:MalM family protein n=1 Tax=Marinobacter sp. TaxID=50741 RepID=UPI0034A306D2
MLSKRFRNLVCLMALAGVLLAGCQSTGEPSAGKDGYFTWVDAQGRVQQSPIYRQPEQTSPAEAYRQEHQAPESEFNLENYPDGVQLERDGYVRPGEPPPYFSWRDADGNIRVSYYQPDTRSAVEKGRIKPPIELTPASIYQQGTQPEPAPTTEGGDPDAFAILDIDEPSGGYFEQWQSHCCESLDTGEVEQWQGSREFGLTIDGQTPVHDFMTGNSPYLLVRLPMAEERKGFILRLRSFAREGVFVPSLALLNADLKPVRIVTDMVADFVPESWHRRGYLEAFVPVFPGHGERWLLLYTRTADTLGQTIIEDKWGPRAIRHVRMGELSVTELSER